MLVRTVKGLGRRFSWTQLLDNDDRQGSLFETEVACDCFDGGLDS